MSVIIVNYNTRNLLSDCLFSLKEEYEKKNWVPIEIIVVDNASKDGSIKMVRTRFPFVQVIKNTRNVGFAKANNQGIKKASGQFILLLNSDTKVFPTTLKNIISPFFHLKHLAVTGGKLLNADGSIQPSAGFSPTLLRVVLWMLFLDDIPWIQRLIRPYHITDTSLYQKDTLVDWVSGACFCIRRDVIDAVGPLDERFFMYGEEVEWCYRIRKAGYRVLFTSSSPLYHYKGGSSKEKGESGIVEEFQGLLSLYKKHYSFGRRIILRMILALGALLRIIVFGIIGKYPKRRGLYAKAFEMARQ